MKLVPASEDDVPSPRRASRRVDSTPRVSSTRVKVRLSQDIGAWDTSSVTNMEGMFLYCTSYEGRGIGAWDTSSVTAMQQTFCRCDTFEEDLSAWNTSSVTSMRAAFGGCVSFRGEGIGAWDTSSVTSMRETFCFCHAFEEDLSAWDVSAVTDARDMFGSVGDLLEQVPPERRPKFGWGELNWGAEW